MRINLSALEALRDGRRIADLPCKFIVYAYQACSDSLPPSFLHRRTSFIRQSRLPYKNWFMTPLCGPCGINEGFGTGTIQKGVL
jgi:hypothetical protein